MTVEHLSMITTPITLLRGDEEVSQGTGFYYGSQRPSDSHIAFLVTNHHVLDRISSPNGTNSKR